MAEYPPMSIIFPNREPAPKLPALVGLIGRKRSGKDSFAARLVDRHGFARFAFADPLKHAAHALNPIVGQFDGGLHRLADVVDAYGWEHAKDQVPEVRRVLQAFGVGLRDALDPDVWVRHTMRQVDRHPGSAVITDVRFPNEANAIVSRGGLLVRIRRPGTTDADPHVSEHALDDYATHHEVLNDATLADLHAAADKIAGAA